jgi:hypothetical protein
MEWLLEIALVVLLAVTLFHAVRLERALGVLKRDRVTLEELVSAFNSSTAAAEHGIDRLRNAADGAGRQLARQIDTAGSVKDDLQFLTERGNRLADQLDQLVRAAKPLARQTPFGPGPEPRAYRAGEAPGGAADNVVAIPAAAEAVDGRIRSQAERDLLKALRMAR